MARAWVRGRPDEIRTATADNNLRLYPRARRMPVALSAVQLSAGARRKSERARSFEQSCYEFAALRYASSIANAT